MLNFNVDIPDKISDKDGLDSILGQTELEVEAELIKNIEETKQLYKKKQSEFK